DPPATLCPLRRLGEEVSADEAGGAGDENLQSRIGPVMPQTSTTSRSLRSTCRYAQCGAAMTSTSDSAITRSSGRNDSSLINGSVQRTRAPLNAASLRSLWLGEARGCWASPCTAMPRSPRAWIVQPDRVEDVVVVEAGAVHDLEKLVRDRELHVAPCVGEELRKLRL